MRKRWPLVATEPRASLGVASREALVPLPADLAGKFIANSRSHVYHKPGCPNAAKISAANRVAYDSADAAERAGYRPGKDCHPRSGRGE